MFKIIRQEKTFDIIYLLFSLTPSGFSSTLISSFEEKKQHNLTDKKTTISVQREFIYIYVQAYLHRQDLFQTSHQRARTQNLWFVFS